MPENRMPCPLQQELIEKVRRHLLNISELARRIAEAIANRNENTAAELDRQVDLKNVDLGIHRDFRINERNLSNPGTKAGSTSTFGKISTTNAMRRVQLGLRFAF
jgi:hypothetical protein